ARWTFRGKDAGRVDSFVYRRNRGRSIGASSAFRRLNLHSAGPSYLRRGLDQDERRELALQVRNRLVVGERRRDVLGERVERPVSVPEQDSVPRVHVLVRPGVELGLDPTGGHGAS